jgi:phosphoglycolate phosphatase
MNIFFDLDGTLINSHKRLFALFQYLVPSSNLSFDEYWTLKRNKVNHKEILTKQFNYSLDEFHSFEESWLKEIELEKWLNLDIPFDGVSEFLKELRKNNILYLVTARQSKEMVYKQIGDFGWETIFEKIFVTEQKIEKHLLIENNVSVSANDWIIGDTGKDIETGKKLNINTAAVINGFLNKDCLAQYNPNIILESVTNFNLDGRF